MIQARMQDEIDDLRLALEVAKQTIVCISRCLADNYLKEKE
jgi:hypothetical protein